MFIYACFGGIHVDKMNEELHTQEGIFTITEYSFHTDTKGYRYVLFDTYEGKRFRSYSRPIYEQMQYISEKGINPPFKILIAKRFSKKYQYYFTVWRIVLNDIVYGFQRVYEYGRYIGIRLYEAKRDTQLWQKEKRLNIPDIKQNMGNVLFEAI